MSWFSKESKSCPHGEIGSCARCVIGDVYSGSERYVALEKNLVLECVALLPSYVNEDMRQHGKKIILSGGAIRDTLIGVTPKDIDIFSGKARAEKLFTNYKGLCREPLIERPGKNSFSAPLGQRVYQFIYRFEFDSPEALLDQFDYSICRAAIWYDREGKEWTGISWHSWQQDTASKHLVFLDHEPEQAAILRLLDFTKRGYSIGPVSLARVLTSLAASVPATHGLDLEAFEAGLMKGFEELRDKNTPKVESVPYKPPRVVNYSDGGS